MGGTAHREPGLPVGTVTFLRTDVEGSTRLVQTLGSRWDVVNATHLELLRSAVAAHGGVEVRSEGDALFAAFADAGAAAAAAIDAQRALAAHPWPAGAAVRVRMGLHSGAAHLAGDDYGGVAVSTAARVAAAGHGGQIVLTEPTRALLTGTLDAGVTIRDLGAHELRDLRDPERLYQLDVPGLPAAFPPLRVAAASAPGNLPLRLTSFRGRAAALDELRALLRESRLVTLTGPGGIGKTSLATELARSEAAGYPDGAWFVALDPVADASAVPGLVARTLGLYDGPERPAADALSGHVAQRSLLLVLDNFEHVLPAAGAVADLLRASPGSRVVVTSRAPLRLTGEQEYPVRALVAADAEHDAATQLFGDRARAVRPGWAPGPDAGAVREVCELVDGLPLGIELAAARVSALPVRVIRDRLAARLALPGEGPRDLPARQRTLDATVEWSYDLLTPFHQHLLGDVAVFDGGFDVDQVHDLHDPGASPDEPDVLDGLVTLVDSSLVVGESQVAAVADDADGLRFRLLRTVADHALRRVAGEGRETDLRRRHAAAYLALASTAASHVPGRDQARWLRRLHADHANLSAAMRWSIDAGETALALDLGAALWRYWQLDGHLAEGRHLLELALRLPGADEPTRSRLAALDAVGGLAYWQGDRSAARHWYREQLMLARAMGDRQGEADALLNVAYVYVFVTALGEPAEWRDPATPDRAITDPFEMVDLLERAYAELGDARGLARVALGRAHVAILGGDTTHARREIEGILERFDWADDVMYHAMACDTLAWLSFRDGDLPAATRWMLRSTLDTYEAGDRSTTTLAFSTGAILAALTGQPVEAAVLAGAFEALCERYGVRPPADMVAVLDAGDPVQLARASLPEAEFTAATDLGRRMSLDDGVRLLTEVCHRVQHS